MREKKFGKRCLTWVLIMMMTLSLLPVSAMAADGEARFYRKNVTSTYARDTGLTAEQSDKNDQGNDEAGEVPEEEPDYAAKIGSATYETLRAAIEAANETDPVVLAKDLTENVVINKSLTLDLNGKTLTGDGMDSVVTITGENTIVTIMSSALNEDESVKNGSITGGVGSKDHNFCFGGGVFIVDATVTLSNLTISKNCADREYDETANYDRTGGGGIASVKANLTLNNVTVTNNYTKIVSNSHVI